LSNTFTLDVGCTNAAVTKAASFDAGKVVSMFVNEVASAAYTYPLPTVDLTYC